MRHRRNELTACVSRSLQNKSTLQNHGHNVDVLERGHKHIEECLAKVDDSYRKKAADLRLTIVPLPQIDVKMLLDMSLNGDEPFEVSQTEAGDRTKEKGFRDATIMFTILESTRGQDGIVVVTNDQLLAKGIERRKAEYKANLTIVPTIRDAVTVPESELEEAVKEARRQMARRATKLLERYRPEIAGCVSAEVKELTDLDLGQSPLFRALAGREAPEPLDIERVLSLETGKISSAVWKDSEKPTSRIFFRVECTARVLASPPARYFSPSTKYSIGGPKPSVSRPNLFEREPATERNIPVTLYGVADFKRVADNWALTRVSVERGIPEDWLDSAQRFGAFPEE